MTNKHEFEHPSPSSREWSAGVLVSAGKLTFSTSKGQLLPTFVAKLNAEKRGLLIAAAMGLGLRNRVYLYKPKKGLGFETILVVRDLGQLKNIILPIMYKGLFVAKHTFLQDWINRIESDPRVPERYRILPKLCRGHFYEKDLFGETL